MIERPPLSSSPVLVRFSEKQQLKKMVATSSSRSSSEKKRPAPQAEAAESKEENNIILPESIYWEYVRPFTPIEDRAVISKRCSTRYYAGKRVDLNETYLKKLERRVKKMKDADDSCWGEESDTVVYSNIPIARGDPGTKHFRIDFCFSDIMATWNSEHSVRDPYVALEMLRHARNAWDEHMSTLPSPSERLQACLEILHSDDVMNHPPFTNFTRPFLFVGKGEIGDVVRFHASLNPSALSGPVKVRGCGCGERLEAFPNTQLGYWIAQYVNVVMMGLHDRACYNATEGLELIVWELLDAGANVSAFFEPLDEYPRKFSALSALDCQDFFEPEMSMYEVMRRFLRWFRRQDDDHFDRTRGLTKILDALARKSNIKLRFDVDCWVECYMGEEEGWKGGIVTEQWSDGHICVVELDGSIATVPVDSDDFIRRPELRFSVGDRVECNMPSGWMPGNVTKVWSDFAKGCPYEIVLDAHEEGAFATAPADWDKCIRRLSLRFDVGDRVECYMGEEDGWMPGTVVTAQWSDFDEENPYELRLPYEVELDIHDEGQFCIAPLFDRDELIRALNE
jgi:hypothetical protein